MAVKCEAVRVSLLSAMNGGLHGGARCFSVCSVLLLLLEEVGLVWFEKGPIPYDLFQNNFINFMQLQESCKLFIGEYFFLSFSLLEQ